MYSIVIPFYNEEASVKELLDGVADTMKGLREPYEIIAVNDGSSDGTRAEIEKISGSDPSVILLDLSGNKGQTACLAGGFSLARGNIVISMDGDLQDDPAEIPAMLRVLKDTNADVVCGWRKNRRTPVPVLFISRLGNFFQRAFLRLSIHDISCTLRIYKKDAAKAVDLSRRGAHRFIPFILKREGFTLAEKVVAQRPRKYGSSKYSLKKVPETISLFLGLLFGKY
ncbi:MAG: glycosyltransferase [Candidatus Makaraimicrobium thalassicum]|nr:MAG: glycosyltransferase [Candidatus Omnitrophota bacterium]